MERRISISSANRLGDRLRKAEQPSEEDLRLLQEVLADHAAPMAEVQRVLTELDLQSTARLKTYPTIIDKLKRDATRLSKMQDLAGARVVRNMTLIQQDRIVARILKAFAGSQAVDLRAKPRSGYRAVHVLVPVNTCTVEVQVRTEMQDLWANVVESFEGEMGRGIRYGGKPAHPRQRVGGIVASNTGRQMTQTQVLRGLLALSRTAAQLEEARVALKEASRAGATQSHRRAIQKQIAQTEKEVKSLFKGLIRARRKGARS